MKMEQIECSETLAYKIQTPGNHPEENIQYVYTKSFTLLQHINQRLQIQFRAPDDERCAARNMLSLQ
jgi:hypothetical protein